MVDNSLTHPLVYKWTPSRPVSIGSHDVPQVANRDAMDRFQDLHLGIFKHFKKACFMRERRDYKPSLAAGVESPNMTLPELFPGCRSPWAGCPDAVGYLGPVTQKDTGSWSHSHCIAYGKQSLWMLYQLLLIIWDPSRKILVFRLSACTQSFSPIINSFSSFNSVLKPFIHSRWPRVIFSSAQNIPWCQGRRPWCPICICCWPEARLLYTSSLQQASLTFSIQLAFAKVQVSWQALTCPRIEPFLI